MVNASAATSANTGIGSGIFNPGSMNLGNMNGFGNAGSIYNNMATGAANYANQMRERSRTASDGVGSSLNNILKDNSSSINDFFDKKFGMGNYRGGTDRTNTYGGGFYQTDGGGF
jgi:hypothetical protein